MTKAFDKIAAGLNEVLDSLRKTGCVYCDAGAMVESADGFAFHRKGPRRILCSREPQIW